jgi:adenylate kinase
MSLNVLLLGIQGSGKGTQARRISTEYEIPHVATGDMFRAEIAAGSELGNRVRGILERGDLVPDDVTVAMIRARLAKADAENGFVLDGFPRTMTQADALDALLAELGKPLTIVFELQVPDEVARERMSKRALEEGRVDDTPDVIARRVELYHRETEPIVQHYRALGYLVGIHGLGTVDEVFAEIQEALEQAAVRQ